MKALAFAHDPPRVHALAAAFKEGCRRQNVHCELRRDDQFSVAERADVVFMYGLGHGRKAFDAYAGKAVRIVADVGYWRDLMARVAVTKRYVRVAVENKQPDAHLRLRAHPRDRFDALRLAYAPVTSRGRAILICGHSQTYARELGLEYGQWERDMVDRIRAVTARPIIMREKPKNPKIDVPGVQRCDNKKCTDAIRNAWAVVVKSGNVGADCILHGIPVYADHGPGAVYGLKTLAELDSAMPLGAEERIAALSDIAYAQWTPEEIQRGDLWAHLKSEGLIV